MKILTQEIPKRGAFCTCCKKHFSKGDELLSVLLEEPPYRHDYCLECGEGAPEEHPKWKSRIPHKVKSPYANMKKGERALAIFQDLLKDPEDRWGEIFILAQYLEREKILILRQDRISLQGIPVSIYEIAATEEIVKIPRLDPKALPLEKIQAALASYLSDDA